MHTTCSPSTSGKEDLAHEQTAPVVPPHQPALSLQLSSGPPTAQSPVGPAQPPNSEPEPTGAQSWSVHTPLVSHFTTNHPWSRGAAACALR